MAGHAALRQVRNRRMFSMIWTGISEHLDVVGKSDSWSVSWLFPPLLVGCIGIYPSGKPQNSVNVASQSEHGKFGLLDLSLEMASFGVQLLAVQSDELSVECDAWSCLTFFPARSKWAN